MMKKVSSKKKSKLEPTKFDLPTDARLKSKVVKKSHDQPTKKIEKVIESVSSSSDESSKDEKTITKNQLGSKLSESSTISSKDNDDVQMRSMKTKNIKTKGKLQEETSDDESTDLSDTESESKTKTSQMKTTKSKTLKQEIPTKEQKTKKENKDTKKKSVITDSDSSDSSKEKTKTKKIKKQSKHVDKKALQKTLNKTSAIEPDSSSDSDSESDSESSVKPTDAKNQTTVKSKTGKTVVESDSSSNEDTDSESESKTKKILTKTKSNKPAQIVSSDSESDSDSDDSSEKVVKKELQTKTVKSASDTDSDDDSNDSSQSDQDTQKNTLTKTKPIKTNKNTDDDSDDDDSDDDDDNVLENPEKLKEIETLKEWLKNDTEIDSDDDSDDVDMTNSNKIELEKNEMCTDGLILKEWEAVMYKTSKGYKPIWKPTKISKEPNLTTNQTILVRTFVSKTNTPIMRLFAIDTKLKNNNEGVPMEDDSDIEMESKKRGRLKDTAVQQPTKKIQLDDNKHEVFVGGLPYGTTEMDLKKLFEESCGLVLRVKVLGQGGAAFIQFSSKEGVDSALEWHQTEYKGRKLNINLASEKPQQGAQNGFKGGRGSIQEVPNSTVIVRNIPFSATENDFHTLFADCGTVQSVRIPTFQDSGKLRGFAMVNFASAEEAQAAMSKSGLDLSNRTIQIEIARPREQSAGGNRESFNRNNRGGRGGHRGGRGGRPSFQSSGTHQTFDD